VIDRVHVLSVELDLCKLPSIHAAATRLLNGELRDPTGVVANGEPVSIPRLDAVICNAGYGGWSGVDWLGIVRAFVTVGMLQMFTYPGFKIAYPSNTLPPQEVSGDQPELAEVFTANFFGHYMLAHWLVPLLSRPGGAAEPAGRVIWTSSIDAEQGHLDMDDMQALRSSAPYESSKRVTDLIALSSTLPSAQKVNSAFFSSPSTTTNSVRPRFYLSHPGIVCTPLFPLPAFLFFFYHLAMYLVRWIGSPWHTTEPYPAAVSAVWLALAPQTELDAANAHHIKWGSACDRCGRDAPKKTEVEGWGFEGEPAADARALADPAYDKGPDGQPLPRFLRKSVGRKTGAKPPTEESRARFEDAAVECWAHVEQLREQWEDILEKNAKGNKK
jgi:3-keto steroid reductase